MSFNIYFAGGLFNHKDLLGNVILGAKVNEVSNGRYNCVLPQNIEAHEGRAEQTRNKALGTLFKCLNLILPAVGRHWGRP
jgi:hypothetical protein